MTDQRIIHLEIKRGSLTEAGRFEGYASTFDGPPDEVGDIILKGAFSKALQHHERSKTTPAMLWGHDLSEPVGKWLSFTEDDHGLLAVGQLTLGTRRGREAFELLQDEALSLSIGFSVAPGGATTRNSIRYITDIARLHEISLVSIPANSRAKVTGVKQSPRIFEQALRERLGLSARESKRATAGGWPALVNKEAPPIDAVLQKIDTLKQTIGF